MPPNKTAENLLLANLLCLGIAFFLHLLGIGSTMLNLARELSDPHGIFGAASAGGSFADGERVGRAIGLGLGAVYSLAGLVVLPIAGYGLYQRRPWGRTLSMLYFASASITLCCTPLGIFGLVTLARKDVRALFVA